MFGQNLLLTIPVPVPLQNWLPCLKKTAWPMFDYMLHTLNRGEDIALKYIENPPHTDQYLLFDSHHPLMCKLGAGTRLHRWTQNVLTTTETAEGY